MIAVALDPRCTSLKFIGKDMQQQVRAILHERCSPKEKPLKETEVPESNLPAKQPLLMSLHDSSSEDEEKSNLVEEEIAADFAEKI